MTLALGNGGIRYLIILVPVLHPIITLILRDNLTRILHNNLMWFEGPIAANAVTSICSLDDLDANIVFAPFLVAFLELLKAAVAATLGANIAISIVALVEHVAVQAAAIAAAFVCADAA